MGAPSLQVQDRLNGREVSSPQFARSSTQETEHSYQLENSVSRSGSHTTRWLGLAWLSSQEQASLCSSGTEGVLHGNGVTRLGAIIRLFFKV